MAVEASADKKESAYSITTSSFSENEEILAKTSWKGYIWDSFDKPKDERWFLFKLDATLLFAGCSGVFLRYLDQANINNAFVSGMKEELGLYGNELNYAETCWTIGYVLGQIPSSLILTKVRPHYWLPFLETCWAILTFVSARFSTPSSIYAIRFLVGFIESGHFPGIMYITSSWYTKAEMSKRNSIIQFCTGVGPMFSGYLQSAAYTGLDGVHGMSGWRWLFIVDGILSLPLALLSFFLIPDFPRTAKKNWLFTEKEIELAIKRVPQELKSKVGFGKKEIISWFSTWHIYLFAALFSLLSLSSKTTSSIPFWFKSYNTAEVTEFTIPQINNYPTPVYAIQILTTVLYAYLSDSALKGKRYIIVVWCSIFQFAVCLGLVFVPVHPSNRAGRWVLYYLLGAYSGSAGQVWTWVNEANLGEPVKRAFVSTMMNSVSYSFLAWVPILLFPTEDQPFVTKGNIACSVFALGSGIFALIGAYIEAKRYTRGFFKSAAPELKDELEEIKETPGYNEQVLKGDEV
ncbi:uncharacterized protein PRCAT00005083001 [Priceomyces carsonii]|uniref:uncharacterized protein n=1 Tax=Priceomyces carsonii TaxID=28549 RepID=UPI002EDB9B57|nr:unnamed protein product [Priceomyces carsonii]